MIVRPPGVLDFRPLGNRRIAVPDRDDPIPFDDDHRVVQRLSAIAIDQPDVGEARRPVLRPRPWRWWATSRTSRVVVRVVFSRLWISCSVSLIPVYPVPAWPVRFGSVSDLRAKNCASWQLSRKALAFGLLVAGCRLIVDRAADARAALRFDDVLWVGGWGRDYCHHGVSGTGKTTVGKLLACALAGRSPTPMISIRPANVEKLRQGIPLDDDDRRPWLDAPPAPARSGSMLEEEPGPGRCSALKHSYRDYLAPRRTRQCPVCLPGRLRGIDPKPVGRAHRPLHEPQPAEEPARNA